MSRNQPPGLNLVELVCMAAAAATIPPPLIGLRPHRIGKNVSGGFDATFRKCNLREGEDIEN